MPVELELKVPEVGESIKEVQIGRWHKEIGQRVAKDENVVELESDKATVDLPAPGAGTLSKVLKPSGEMAAVGEVIGYVLAGAEVPGDTSQGTGTGGQDSEKKQPPAAAGRSRQSERPEPVPTRTESANAEPRQSRGGDGAKRVMPAAERLLAQHGLAAEAVPASGPGGRLLKEDVLRHVEQSPVQPQPPIESPLERTDFQLASAPTGQLAREEELVVMSPIRRRIAQRLVEAQQTAALLTTFNEVDMTEVMSLRQKHKEAYQQRYGVKLGFMSFFVKAAVDALKLVPQVNAEVREPHVVYRNYYDIGIAVGGGKGLVVPVLRNAEFLSFAEIELAIADFGRRAADNKLKVEELQGGTFTISNGGVYGSLLSTPIVNPPQSGILGLHAIQDRPVARGGQVVVRPMMYLALTYDHRIVDGREAVTFLKRIKETIEDPSRILLEV